MAQHGKSYAAARAAIDRERLYSPVEAVRALKAFPERKFDETVEVHFRLGLNVRHADEQLRGTIMLPHGTGKEARVAVFAEGDKAREAEEAGADVVGSADLAKQIEEGFTDFDVAIATPDQMGNVGRLGRILGPRGLMPNPEDRHGHLRRGKAVRDAKAGQARVPHRPRRERARVDREEELRRACAASRTTPPCRGDRAGEARRGEGPVHPAGHDHDHDGPRDPHRPGAHPRHRGGAGRIGRRRVRQRGCYCVTRTTRRSPKTAGSREAEAQPRWVRGSALLLVRARLRASPGHFRRK